MATDVEEVSSGVNSLHINNANGLDNHTENVDELQQKWGFDREQLYKLALKFYKEKEGKAMHLSYKEKLKLVAYTKQASYGKYRADVSPTVGFLDVVGKDRRQAWQLLGDLTREGAMTEFIQQLHKLCPLFVAYVQAHKAEEEEQRRRQQEEEEEKQREAEDVARQQLEEEARQRQEEERQRQLQQEAQIRAALNQQTSIQFQQYAEQQFPGNTDQQQVLIAQLQEQHYQQYMQQVYQQQLLHQQQQYQQLQAMAGNAQPTVPDPHINTDALHMQSETPTTGTDTEPMSNSVDSHSNSVANEQEEDLDNENENDLPPIAAASMWTRKDIKEFKDSLRKDPDSVIKVGSGETVTVRVPTHEDGTCLFWEFATDSYDLGFGVYFEWTIAPSNQVSVHVSESSDEEDLEEEEGATSGGETKADIEKGGPKKDNRPPTDEIIPVYRRDCHEEVYCGSHMYPGRGVYLLKFDNSYSLWRSKTLYYRVYYTR